jgi:origin recognition complex subunit 4
MLFFNLIKSGSFQYDDKSALIEISKQLKLDNVINDRVFGSFADSFEFLIKSFRTGNQSTKPLIFIMDEFDLFTKNKTQLLLYTLLNTIQTSSSPMCLVGVTVRIDVLDLLEKRIKSRFSHRQIYLFNDYSFTKFIEMTKFFILNDECFKMVKLNKYLEPYVNELVNDNRILKRLNRLFDYDKSITTLKRLLLLPILRLSYMEKEVLKTKDISVIREEFFKSFDLLDIDTKFSMLKGVSILELTLIVVMLEMSQLFPEQPFNFDLILNSYYKFCQKRNWGQQKYEKQIILKVSKFLRYFCILEC